MFVVCKTIKDQEYLRSKEFSILCKSKNQADIIASHLINNNDKSIGSWKLKDNETWKVYQLDNYDYPPQYKIKSCKGKISIVYNI